MKRILDMLSKLMENPFLAIIIGLSILLGIIFAPFVVCYILDLKLSSNIGFFLYAFYIIFVYIYWEKFFSFFCILGLLSFTLSFVNPFLKSLTQKTSTNVHSTSYHARREYSPNYSYHDSHSNSSNRYSEPSDYISPQSIETEPLIPQKDNEEHNNQGSSKLSDVFSEPSNINSDEISPPPSETAIYERWEYVTSDYQGNDYYINKNFGVNISITSLEGKVFYASFKKVLSNGGREVEVPVYDINRGEIIERKILAYEESIIRFRNLNGVKEFSFYAMSGYTPDNFAIIGWGIDNIDGTYNWQPINDEVYDALYNAAYEKLE